MRTRKPRRSRPRAEWEALVAEWRASGLSQKEFARRKGIAATTLSWWSCRLRREDGGLPSLVPVQVVPDAAEGEFRVELAGRRTVVVPASFDAGALRRLVAVLEGEAC